MVSAENRLEKLFVFGFAFSYLIGWKKWYVFVGLVMLHKLFKPIRAPPTEFITKNYFDGQSIESWAKAENQRWRICKWQNNKVILTSFYNKIEGLNAPEAQEFHCRDQNSSCRCSLSERASFERRTWREWRWNDGSLQTLLLFVPSLPLNAASQE